MGCIPSKTRKTHPQPFFTTKATSKTSLLAKPHPSESLPIVTITSTSQDELPDSVPIEPETKPWITDVRKYKPAQSPSDGDVDALIANVESIDDDVDRDVDAIILLGEKMDDEMVRRRSSSRDHSLANAEIPGSVIS